MKGRLLDLAFGLDGNQRLTVELDEDFRTDFDELKDFDVEVTVKKYRKKRSLDANSYCWVLIDKISAKTGVPKSKVYRDAIREIGGVSDTVCVVQRAAGRLQREWVKQGLGWQVDIQPSRIPGCLNVTLYYGSSTYDTEQMSRLIDNLCQECNALNIPTRQDIEQMMEEYDAKFNHDNGTANG